MICIAGKNDIAVEALNMLLKNKNVPNKKIIGIPNANSFAEDTWQLSFPKALKTNNIQTATLEDVYGINDIVFISTEFDKIIRTKKFKSRRLYNLHFSLLPQYKGMYTSIWPILNGEREAGVTLHLIDDGIDTGDIIAQQSFEIPIEYTSRDLYIRYMKESTALLKKHIDNLLDGTIESRPQPIMGASYYAKDSIDFNNIVIDLNKTAFEIYNQIRAFIFPEYQLPVVQGYKINKVTLLTQCESDIAKRGRVEDLDDFLILIGIDGYKVKALKA